ncbi:hypothetical protein PIB30_091564 [Stylosanthes scabra]|uniref:F-box domain-containing protein n=1 Tax=Stylosanthes scabra TaxID=79078 RepID=A0ABU6YTW8_9FABA|nr:hypothetical protein [Stylosanthes scabra]
MSRHKHDDECDLPLELIGEILARLPVRLLLQLKTVCRSWNSLISSHDFTMQHVQRSAQPRLAYACSRRILEWTTNYGIDVLNCTLPSLLYDQQQTLTKFVPFPKGMNRQLQFSIEGSCNGLLCLSQGTPYLILTLFNPCTGSTSRTAPTENPSELGKSIYYGFGYDILHDKYKFVMGSSFNYLKTDPHKMVRCGAKVCTFDANPSWKEIDHPVFPYSIQNGNGKYSGGTINWIVYDPTKDVVVGHNKLEHREWFIFTFKLETESFGRLCLPGPRKNNDITHLDVPRLQVLKNRLCVSFQPLYTTNPCTYLWMMMEEEYDGLEKSNWTMLFTIPHGDGIPQQIVPLYISEDDLLLVYNPLGSSDRSLFVYNLHNGKLFYPWLHSTSVPDGSFDVYHESLVSPSHFL